MTLIISVVSRSHAVLVSDRRLTRGSKVLDDEANKATTFVCRDARVLIGFTGLATLDSFNTHEWLLETLSKCAPPDYEIAPTLERLRVACTERWRTLPKSSVSKKLSLLVAGFRYDADSARGIACIISNYERLGEPELPEPFEDFAVQTFRERQDDENTIALVLAAGGHGAVSKDDFESLVDLARRDTRPEWIVEKSISTVRHAADKYVSIGKQCTSAVLPRKLDSEVSVSYHSAETTTRLHGISHVQATGPDNANVVFMNPYFEALDEHGANVVLQTAPSKGRHRCHCGSGRRFKRCHGRRAH